MDNTITPTDTQVSEKDTPRHWSQLSDQEKAKILLDSARLADAAPFLDEFTSFEFPDPERVQSTERST